ncbi:hypothetical protein ALC53_05674 [Atta colombica]|uniref:Mos1 transposase HTH domain-containing protein n=1 Tax=Atta colombica TaxID=520822 RepID=A0A151I3K0_9HYME|nr:hypothetical protein ALC53_05674 [Atta colombica]
MYFRFLKFYSFKNGVEFATTSEFLTKNETNIIQQSLRGTRFNSRKEVMEKSKMALMAILTIEFQKCFESWIKRWHKCVTVDGDFEGDNITFDK